MWAFSFAFGCSPDGYADLDLPSGQNGMPKCEVIGSVVEGLRWPWNRV
jgi:hypothetical protein